MILKKTLLPLLLLAASLAACGERATVALAEVDASPAAIARDQYRYLRGRGDVAASKLKGAEPVWYPLYGRYKEWASLLAKAEALTAAAPANTELAYQHLDFELNWIERQADTYGKYIELRRSDDYEAMRQLAPKFAAADQQAARQLATRKPGDGEAERSAMHKVLEIADKLREGKRGLDRIRATQAALDRLQPDGQETRMMASIIRRAERSVQELYGLDGEAEAFEALQGFAAAEVRFKVDEASCSKLEVDGAAKGWHLPVRAIDANGDEIDYVTIGKSGGAHVGSYFYLVASKSACEQIASRLKDQVLASKPAGTFGMHYPDGLPHFDLVGNY